MAIILYELIFWIIFAIALFYLWPLAIVAGIIVLFVNIAGRKGRKAGSGL